MSPQRPQVDGNGSAPVSLPASTAMVSPPSVPADPLAQYHPPGALAMHQLKGVPDGTGASPLTVQGHSLAAERQPQVPPISSMAEKRQPQVEPLAQMPDMSKDKPRSMSLSKEVPTVERHQEMLAAWHKASVQALARSDAAQSSGISAGANNEMPDMSKDKPSSMSSTSGVSKQVPLSRDIKSCSPHGTRQQPKVERRRLLHGLLWLSRVGSLQAPTTGVHLVGKAMDRALGSRQAPIKKVKWCKSCWANCKERKPSWRRGRARLRPFNWGL